MGGLSDGGDPASHCLLARRLFRLAEQGCARLPVAGRPERRQGQLAHVPLYGMRSRSLHRLQGPAGHLQEGPWRSVVVKLGSLPDEMACEVYVNVVDSCPTVVTGRRNYIVRGEAAQGKNCRHKVNPMGLTAKRGRSQINFAGAGGVVFELTL